MPPIWIFYGLLIVGLLVAIFAQQIGDLNVAIVQRLPGPLHKAYDIASLGRPFNSSPWILYNRIGGAVVALGGLVGVIFALR